MTPTVFIAVNDPNIQYLLQRYSEESGFRALGAAHADEALALLAQPADLALLILGADFGALPGDAARAALIARAAARHIPVVIYSSLDEAHERATRPAGVTGYLPRSVMYDDFVAELGRAGLCAGARTLPQQERGVP